MSQYSVALWNKLPPITERSSCVHRACDLKSSVSQNTMNVLTPVQTHLQPIEAKRAMLILDDLVTKIFALLVGDEATNIFKEIQPLAKELDEGITPGSSLKILEVADQWTISDPIEAFFNKPKNRLAVVKDRVFSLSRHLIRSLMSNKEACFALLRHYKQWDVEACPVLKHLGSLLVQMRFLVRQALLTTTKEKTMREEYQNKTERRMHRQLRLIEEMTTDLSNQTEEHNKMVRREIFRKFVLFDEILPA
ncbi:unnamed protein product [Schistocephalus solidus]|uniref:Dynamin_M domain-containing protein n=1 Tax=Schistocephalus solidus TaxID=70667 RepID=A0A183SU89_SCHSO|nr:unnamed protein product [Schistocephalus solidus]